jgi:hypothetical protein
MITPLTPRQNKLECLSLACFLRASLTFMGKAKNGVPRSFRQMLDLPENC